MLEAATWRSNPAFASFHLHVLSLTLDICHSGHLLWLAPLCSDSFSVVFVLFRFVIPTISSKAILPIIRCYFTSVRGTCLPFSQGCLDEGHKDILFRPWTSLHSSLDCITVRSRILCDQLVVYGLLYTPSLFHCQTRTLCGQLRET